MASRQRRRLPPPSIPAPSSLLVKGVNAKRAAKEAARPVAATKRPAREPVAVDAPPLSSSEEEEEEERKDEIDDISDSSSPEDGRTTRGDVQRTAFKRSSKTAALAGVRGGTAGHHGSSSPMNHQKRPPTKGLLIADEWRKGKTGTNGSNGDSANSANNANNNNSGEVRGTKRLRPREEPGQQTQEGDSSNAATAAAVAATADNSSIPFERPRRAPLRPAYGSQKTASTSAYSRGVRSMTSISTITTITSSKQRATSKPDKYDGASDLSEPEEKPKWPGTPPPPPTTTARFIKPPELTPEEKTPPKKFQFSKYAKFSDDDGEEGGRTQPAAAAAPRPAFKVPRGIQDDDEEEARKEQQAPTKRAARATRATRATRAGGKETVATTRTRTSTTESSIKSSSQELLKTRQPWRQNLDKKKKNGTENEPLSPSPPPEQRAVFKMPTRFNDSFAGGGGQGGEADFDSNKRMPDIADLFQDDNADADADGAANDDSDDTMAYKGPAVCPLCKAPLDEAMLHALLPGHHLLAGFSSSSSVGNNTATATAAAKIPLNLLKFDEKLRFCAGHKQRASRQAWTARGYPAIDWAALPARLERHYAHVEGVLLGKTPSPFRAYYLEGERARAKKKTTVKELLSSSSTTGYYGRRGLRVLSEAIVHRLADVLRRRAVEDPLVAARGMAQFVQAVLVPELAVQLIREDMQLGGDDKGEDKARRILRESAAIGEAVMDEERDVVEEDDEEGEEVDGGGEEVEDEESDGIPMYD